MRIERPKTRIERLQIPVATAGTGFLLLAALAACGGNGRPPGASGALPNAVANATARRFPDVTSTAIPTPAFGDYLGAWVEPTGSQTVETAIEGLESNFTPTRTLDLHLHYVDWNAPFPSPSDPLVPDYQNRRAPIVSWHCVNTAPGASPPANDELYRISHGLDDSILDQLVNALTKGSGVPDRIFLRWFWEFNISVTPTGGNYANGNDCFANVKADQRASEFKSAWIYMHNYFVSHGATNVTWLWNPNIVADGGTDYNQFYPGAAYVDWIGVDGYDKPGRMGTLAGVFGPFLTDPNIVGYKKPVMITETAACSGAPAPDTQAHYLGDVGTQLETAYPQLVRALVYFDATGKYCPANGLGTYFLNGPGLTAFQGLADSRYFTPTAINPP